jgi:hypothetical protein
MAGIIAPNVAGRREMLLEMLFLADHRQTVATSMLRKPKSSNNEKTGISNSQIGTYFAKVLGDLKPGGVRDGADVKAFDSNPNREPISFRPEKYRRAPMVGDLARGDDIAGVSDAGSDEWEEALSTQMILHKRDIEKEILSEQDSSIGGGAEGGTTMRGFGRWINAGELPFSELPVPQGAATPAAQIYTGILGDGITTGLTEDVVSGLLQARWDATGDSGQLVGLLGTAIKNRFAFFSKYKANVTNATVIIRTQAKDYDSHELDSPSIDVYNSDWGSFSLIPVSTLYLPDAKTGYFLDMSQCELRSRYWMREKPLPDLGGGPRELIESFVALIPGDLRSHVKIHAT